jgi:hypothetical protein
VKPALVHALLLVLMAFATATQATPGAVPEGVKVPAWSELSEQQKTDLARFSGHWDRMPASRRVQILERYEHWRALPEDRREAMRGGVQNFREMSPEQRQKMRRSLQLLKSLPPERQRALRERWQRMSPQQRREWLDAGGPGVAPPPKP